MGGIQRFVQLQRFFCTSRMARMVALHFGLHARPGEGTIEGWGSGWMLQLAGVDSFKEGGILVRDDSGGVKYFEQGRPGGVAC